MYMSLGLGHIGVRAPLVVGIDYAKRYKFTGLDINIAELAELIETSGPELVKAMFENAGIKAGAWGLPVHVNNDDATWDEGVRDLPRLARAALAVGTSRAFTYIMSGHNELEAEAYFDAHVKRLKPVASILADHGIRLGLEWVGTQSLRESFVYPFIHTMAGALELASALGPNVGLLVDIYHLENSGATASNVKQLSNEQIVHVHVNDALAGVPAEERLDTVRDLPGYSGELSITAFLQALLAVRYDGPVTAEPFNQRLRELPDETAVAELSAAMHSVWQKAGL